MGGICGIVNFDRTPVQRSALGAMADAAYYRGRDGVRYRIEANAGFAHLAFHTTPEAAFERQPARYGDGRFTLIADARIDNRDDLVPRLFPHLDAEGLRRLPDTDIIFGAFAKWGHECGREIIGDYAIAIWDNHEQILFAIRDTMGMRPFFYRMRGAQLLIGSTVASVLRGCHSEPELNMPWIENFIREDRRRWIRETAYRGIYRLPPSWRLTVSDKGLVAGSYHKFGSGELPVYKTDDDWIAAFRELFEKVLAAQTRSVSPVAVHLSGGLDSASIACTLHKMGASQPIPDIKLASMLYRDTPSADEATAITKVRDRCIDFDTLTLYGDSFWAFRDFDLSSGFPLDEPDIYPFRAHHMALLELGVNSGCRVTINGDMSNLVLGDGVYFSPQALRALPLSRLTTEIGHYKKRTRKGYLALTMRACVPEVVTDALLRSATIGRKRMNTTYPWLRTSMPYRSFAPPRIAEEIDHEPKMGPVAKTVLGMALSPYNLTRMAFNVGVAAFCGTEQRIPYVDRRIVEFGIQLPMHLACSQGLGRVILRESMRDTVPGPIRTSSRSGHLSDLIIRGFKIERDTINSLLRGSVLEEMGMIDSRALSRRIQLHQNSTGRLGHEIYSCLHALYMENWLRRRN